MITLPSLAIAAALLAQQPIRPPRAADQSAQPIIIEQLYQRLRFESDGTGWRELSVRLVVQTEAGVQQAGQLAYGYNSANESLTVDSVRIHKASGSLVSASPEAVQDVTGPIAQQAPVYSDYRQKIVTVPALRPGDTLEYHVLWTSRPLEALGNFWYQYDFTTGVVVRDERVEVDVPRDKYLKVKSAPGTEPQVSETRDRRIYRWKHATLEPHPEEVARRLRAAMGLGKVEPHSIQLTTFRSWEDIGRWYADLERERESPTPPIRSKAAELVRDRTTRRDSIMAMYDFVAKSYRYVSLSFGIGRYQPHAAADVLANQYGDCKDKHTLLASLLSAVGLRAYPALISSGADIDSDVPAPSQFDHLITAVPEGDSYLWLDTTPEVAPFAFIMLNLRSKRALVIPAAAPPRLVVTPREPPSPALYEVAVAGQLNSLGTLRATVRHVTRGDAEVLFRIGFRATPQSQWQKLAEIVAADEGIEGDVAGVTASDPADTREPFRFEFQVTRPVTSNGPAGGPV